jgi:4-hydroxy-3-methylbut-2-enyl diphosphate reductase
MTLTDANGGMECLELGPDVRLCRPSTDMLHDPNVEPQAEGCDEVFLGLPLGECGGVRMANRVIELVSRRSNGVVYGNHEPTHGADTTKKFEAMGAQFGVAPSDVPKGSPYVISAHGASPDVAEEARDLGLEVFDVTCPLVHKTHLAIKRAAAIPGGHVAYISFGKPDHPEAVGAAGVAESEGVRFSVLSDVADIDAIVEQAKQNDETITVVGQTTNNSDQAEMLANHLYVRATAANIIVWREESRDACHTVRDRQRSARQIVALGVDGMVVVGSVRSKNTLSLAKVAVEEALARGVPLDVYLVNSWPQLVPLLGSAWSPAPPP